MKLQPNLPPLPTVPLGGRGSVTADIAYTGPVLVETRLGEIPSDYYRSSGSSHHSKHSCEGGACSTGGKEIWRGLPTYMAQGAPQVESKIKHIEASANSPLGHGLLGAAIGGGLGGFFGFMGGLVTGRIGLGVAVGAGIGATLAGGGAALHASGDRIKLEWQEHPIEELTLTGYSHDTRERTREECTGFGKDRQCHSVNDGYDHRFTPQIEGRAVGTFWEPEVVHYRAGG